MLCQGEEQNEDVSSLVTSSSLLAGTAQPTPQHTMLAAKSSTAMKVRSSAPVAARCQRRIVRCFASNAPVKANRIVETVARPAMTAAIANIIMALPASAEAGKLFDFNLTLPAMATEFLLLMVFLDKFWFGPVGKVLDERDQIIRDKLGLVKDGGSEIGKLQTEAEQLIAAARAEVAAMVAKEKNATQAECDSKLAAAKARIEKEVNDAIAGLEKEKEALMRSLDSQADKLTAEILRRVLPAGVKV